jgi:2-haloacid dehalogenase
MIAVFDVNETLLDLSALDEAFDTALGDAGLRKVWFSELLHQALVTTASNTYVDLRTLAAAALSVVARRSGVDLDAADRESVLGGITCLPSHPDVEEALRILRDAGIRCGALSNGPPDTLSAQLRSAGLDAHLDPIVSADAVRALKPDPAPYQHVAEMLSVPPSSIWLVAAHPWDTSGAIRAGCRAALVRRPGTVLSTADETPDIVAGDLEEVAVHLVQNAT